ncbi:MAG: hypothetical protein XXXJIFNMEKO3_00756 [Candidatus Erwinia impunctatus]|nr:hypothetical protein XXXJIFNMEKO_00756 [Culicoides impunctatus]
MKKNLSPVCRRTLERLSKAALALYQQNKFPTAEEITREANYAKVTLKTCFSTHNEFIEYIVKKTIGGFQKSAFSNDVSENLRILFTWGYGELYAHEALMRDAMRIAQLRWQQAQNDKDEQNGKSDAFILKNSNRKEALEDVLAPLSS